MFFSKESRAQRLQDRQMREREEAAFLKMERLRFTKLTAKETLRDLPPGVAVRILIEVLQERDHIAPKLLRQAALTLQSMAQFIEAGHKTPHTRKLFQPAQGATRQARVDGWEYWIDDECSDNEVRKWTHWAVQGNYAFQIAVSPYQIMSEEEFRSALATYSLIENKGDSDDQLQPPS